MEKGIGWWKLKLSLLLLAQFLSFWAGLERSNLLFLSASVLLALSAYIEDRRYRLT